MTKQQLCPFDRHCRLCNHIKRHQGFKGFRCDQCDRGYYRRHALTRHVAVAPHQRRHQPLICDHCRQSFINAWALRRHLQHYVVDDGQRAEGRFKWPFYQQQVANYHSEQFECGYCGQRFLIKSRIKRHIRQHMLNYT